MQPEQDESITVQGWGKKIGLTGPNAFPWFVILLLLMAVAYLVQFSLEGWGAPIPLGSTMLAQHQIRSDEHAKLRESINELTYVLTVCLNKHLEIRCSELRLDMPDSIRAKMRRREFHDGDR